MGKIEENERIDLYEVKINDLVESVRKKDIPNLSLNFNKRKFPLGKYAKFKLKYLKENKVEVYTVLLMKNELNNYLYNTEMIAIEMEKRINENAEEIILNEFIYR